LWIAAGTVTWGPWSPPMTSMATVMFLIQPEPVAGMAGWNATSRGQEPRRARTRSPRKLFALGLDDFAATIRAVRADMVTQMSLARGRLDGQRRVGQEIVRAVHAALGRGFFVL